MIIAVDVETQGLNTKNFLVGCLMTDQKAAPEFYYNKESLWDRIVELAIKEQKRHRATSVYSHNAQFDFYAYAPYMSKNMTYFSQRPFIAAFRLNGKEIIKFLDTMSLYPRMSLKVVGDIIGIPKLEMPGDLKSEDGDTDLSTVLPYLERDTLICLQAVLKLRDKIRQKGIKVKRLYTINQIAINYLMNEWKKLDDADFLFWDQRMGQLRKTFRSKEIRMAYRGGRLEARQIGHFENVSGVDCNSLYPFIAANMRFPDLKSERILWHPNKKEQQIMLQEIGIAKALVKNVKNDTAILGIETATDAFYPKSDRYLLGVWTTDELTCAQKNGYEILDIEWFIHYRTAPFNPLTKIMNELYKNRMDASDPFNYNFYKSMMNSMLGKLAQYRANQEIVIDSVALAEEYLKKNYSIIHGLDMEYMYKKEPKEVVRKKYYAPIIPTLVTALARIYMYDRLKHIPIEQFLYMDTDSVYFLGNHLSLFKITNKMGDFKILGEKEPMDINCRRSYRFGKRLEITGVAKRNQTNEAFDEGTLQRTKMLTLRTAKSPEQAGTFVEDPISLKEQREKHLRIMDMLHQERVLIDKDIDDISYFVEHLKNIEI